MPLKVKSGYSSIGTDLVGVKGLPSCGHPNFPKLQSLPSFCSPPAIPLLLHPRKASALFPTPWWSRALSRPWEVETIMAASPVWRPATTSWGWHIVSLAQSFCFWWIRPLYSLLTFPQSLLLRPGPPPCPKSPESLGCLCFTGAPWARLPQIVPPSMGCQWALPGLLSYHGASWLQPTLDFLDPSLPWGSLACLQSRLSFPLHHHFYQMSVVSWASIVFLRMRQDWLSVKWLLTVNCECLASHIIREQGRKGQTFLFNVIYKIQIWDPSFPFSIHYSKGKEIY